MTKTCPDCEATVHTSLAATPAVGGGRETLARELSNALREKSYWTYEDRAFLSLVLIELVRPAESATAPTPSGTQGALALYLNEVQPVDGRVQINVSIDELAVLRHLAGATPAGGGEIQPHIYSPDYQTMGDCRVCGHAQDKPWHAQPATPLRGRENAREEALRIISTLAICEDGETAEQRALIVDACREVAANSLFASPSEQAAAVPAGKLACRRCGGWGTIRLGNMDRETCDLCNGTGNEPAAAPVPGGRPD